MRIFQVNTVHDIQKMKVMDSAAVAPGWYADKADAWKYPDGAQPQIKSVPKKRGRPRKANK